MQRGRIHRVLPLLFLLLLYSSCGDEPANKPESDTGTTPARAAPESAAPGTTPTGPSGQAGPERQAPVEEPERAPDPDALDLAGFLAKLGSPEVDDREWAMYRLGVDFEDSDLRAARARIEPALAKALEDASGDVRRGAVAGLARLGLAQSALLERIAGLLGDPDVPVRAQAADAMGSAGKAATPWIPGLVAALDDAAPVVRHNAAHALASIGGRQAGAEAALLRLLGTDPDDEVRVQAALTLGETEARGDPVAKALLKALDDNHGEVRAAAAWALGALGLAADQARPRLEALLRDDNPEVREAARRALEQLR